VNAGEPGGGRWSRFADVLRERLWFWPAALGLLAAVAAETLVRLDRTLDAENARPLWVFSGNADAARGVLTVIATATMTVLGVTLSITLAVLALTAQGYSPRALRRFMRDRVIQAVIAGFVATFVFALVSLRLVREEQVPGITVNVAVLLGFVVLGLLVVFFHHMASETRVERLIDAIWEETREAIAASLTEPHTADEGTAPVAGALVGSAHAVRTGRIRWIDDAALAAVARESGGLASVERAPGDFVAEGECVVRMRGGVPLVPAQVDRLAAAVMLGTQRSMTQDVAFGLRQLADVGLRALSPGISDPTTAEEAILRLADLLRRLADRRLGVSVLDDDGRTLVVRPRPTWEDLVGLAFDQYARTAEAQADVATTLVLLDALGRVFAATDAPDRLPPLRRRARRLRDGARRAVPDEGDLARIELAAAPLA
jgi:uncharacterized membrane protein